MEYEIKETDRAPGDASQSLISVQSDIQRVTSATPLLGRHLGLAVIVRANRWAAVDDLYDDRVTYTPNRSSTVTASVGDPVASSAVAFRACWALVAPNDTLAVALGEVD